MKRARQERDHRCHWPGCEKQVPPAMWGCTAHWYQLPQHLRNRIWRTYRPGQEINATPSTEYVAVAREVQDWIVARAKEEASIERHRRGELFE